jgi:flagellar protein FliS
MSFAVAQYRTTKLTAQSPLSSLIAVYEGAIRFLRNAIACEAGRDLAGRGTSLSRAHAIVTELRAGLDHAAAPEIAGKLDGLYDFVQHRITEATIKNAASEVVPAIDVMERLLSGWREIAHGGAR